ncbi:menaquinone-dependent protoporphyrinogen IX dehydrogenase [Polaribacter atrinae]|uniref:menaquinone-dependent protoporphyrinogen IX dehydrogenase n=1 Tax=Polaribacter atrinae TaxID=1333662 RepID=UPI002492C43F|nr:menaquinone-dependent protoporphyrinogen IX dehydrogenase [Polaribacter atrinae]
MERKIGIIYCSTDGQTKKICEKLSADFKKEQIKTELFSIENFIGHVSEFHTLIIGASIRYGKHNKKIYDFILKNKEQLKGIKTAFFSVNLVARKVDKNTTATNPYLIKFIQDTNWNPDFLEVFAGKLDYKSYSIIDSIMIKLIMKLTDGPTNSKDPIEFTNWEKVNDFGKKISVSFKSNKPTPILHKI